MPRKTAKPLVRISSTQRAMRVPRKRLTELIAFVAGYQKVGIAEVDLAVVTRDEITSLNRRYLSRCEPTDVLSFDLSDSSRAGLCIQLVICGETTVANARASGLTPQRELMLYVVHGLLHQMGYDDSSARGAVRMHAREDEILEAFQITRRRK
ncbi:MAG: rRNA maturation RNase YbeY [Planctomycetota bacterium]|jgi:probable rRNA maturation factor